MNPLVELKERLHQSAMAGTDLLNEDFRLKKISEQIVPLSAKNPIFKKISERLDELFNADNENKPEKLINAISLVDAVVATQATYKIEGDILDLPESNGIYNNVPYSEFSPIIVALTTVGSGRYEVIDELYKGINTKADDYKEKMQFKIISDFRLKDYWIKALNDPYAGICDLASDILELIGDEKVVEQLKEGFDVKGKKEMVRRLTVIGNIAKEKENDFYIYVYENSNKDMRDEALRCLLFSKDNIGYLIQDVKKRKGEFANKVLNAISFVSDKNQNDFWVDYFNKTSNFSNLFIEGKKTTTVSNAVVKKACELFTMCIAKNMESESDKVSSDYLNYVAYSFQEVGNKLYDGFLNASYDFEYNEDFENFIQRPLDANTVGDSFWTITNVMTGCTLDSLIYLANFVTPAVCDICIGHLSKYFSKDVRSDFSTFFNHLNHFILQGFLENPNSNNANKLIVLYKMYGGIYAESALIASLYLNPNLKYDEFMNLVLLDKDDIINTMRNRLGFCCINSNNNKIVTYGHIKKVFQNISMAKSNGEIPYYYESIGFEKFDISWLEQLEKLNVSPRVAYRLLNDNPKDEEKVIINNYMLYVMKCVEHKKQSKYFNGNDVNRAMAVMVMLGITEPLDIIYEGIKSYYYNCYISERLIGYILNLCNDNDKKVKFFDDFIAMLRAKDSTTYKQIIHRLDTYKNCILTEPNEKLFHYDYDGYRYNEIEIIKRYLS